MTRETALAKRSRIGEPHVRSLNQLVRSWRTGPEGIERFVPWFDPSGPGVNGRVLLLLETPGPATVARGDLGFSSLDNDDPTTRALRRALDEVGLDREQCLRWNVVPWAVHDDNGGRCAPRTDDLEEGRPALEALMSELDELRVVVPLGAAALEGWMRYLTLSDGPRVLPTLAVPHPSPVNGHRRREAFLRTVRALGMAEEMARA